jgi:hypothetical protein
VNFAGVAALGAYVGIQADVLRPEKLFTILTIVVREPLLRKQGLLITIR